VRKRLPYLLNEGGERGEWKVSKKFRNLKPRRGTRGKKPNLPNHLGLRGVVSRKGENQTESFLKKTNREGGMTKRGEILTQNHEG